MRLRGLACAALIGVGLSASAYLMWRHAVLAGMADGADVCHTMFGAGCDSALQSRWAVQLGIPLAGWGVVYYLTLAGLLALGWYLRAAFWATATLTALLLALAAAALSATMGVLIMSGAWPWCPMCVLVHGVNVALPVILMGLAGRSVRELAGELGAAGRYVFGGSVASADQARWRVAGLFLAGLVGVVAYQWMLVQTERWGLNEDAGPNRASVIAAFHETEPVAIDPDPRDPRLGPADAAVELVVFTSFQCPGCRQFAHDLSHHLLETYERDIVVRMKHYPLSTQCNGELAVDQHPHACDAARSAIAAQEQDGFWAYHDRLYYANFAAGAAVFRHVAADVGLDPDQLDADRLSDAADAKLRDDIALGNRLGVDATPAIFLNGRRLRHVSGEPLHWLIQHAVAHAAEH